MIAGDKLLQRLTDQPLHRDEQVAALGLTEIEDPHRVGMGQPRRGSGFLEKPARQLIAFNARALRQQLHGDGVPSRDVLRLVDRAESAAPNHAVDAIPTANHLATHDVTGRRRDTTHRRRSILGALQRGCRLAAQRAVAHDPPDTGSAEDPPRTLARQGESATPTITTCRCRRPRRTCLSSPGARRRSPWRCCTSASCSCD